MRHDRSQPSKARSLAVVRSGQHPLHYAGADANLAAPRHRACDHKNRKTPISKPAANDQRPNVQAEITRTRLRRSCGISSDRSVIAVAPPAQQLLLGPPPWVEAKSKR